MDAELEALYARAEDAKKRKEKRSREQSILDNEEDNEGAEDEEEVEVVDEATGAVRRKRLRLTVNCWYINPRYFVDVIKYRLYLMRRHLESLESSQGNDSMFKCVFMLLSLFFFHLSSYALSTQLLCLCLCRCSNKLCPYEASLMEAVQRHTALQKLSKNPSNGPGIGSVTSAIVAATHVTASNSVFRCPLCDSPLLERSVESISVAAGKLLNRFNEQMRTLGIYKLLVQLDSETLEANSPRALVSAGIVSLHNPSVITKTPGVEYPSHTPTSGAANHPGSGVHGPRTSGAKGDYGGTASGAGLSGGRASSGVYLRQNRTFQVVREHKTAQQAVAASEPEKINLHVPPPPPKEVSENLLPEFLLHNGATGNRATTFGFVPIAQGQKQQEGVHFGAGSDVGAHDLFGQALLGPRDGLEDDEDLEYLGTGGGVGGALPLADMAQVGPGTADNGTSWAVHGARPGAEGDIPSAGTGNGESDADFWANLFSALNAEKQEAPVESPAPEAQPSIPISTYTPTPEPAGSVPTAAQQEVDIMAMLDDDDLEAF